MSVRLKTPVFVISYPHLFKPVAMQQADGSPGRPSWSVTAVFTEEAQKTPEFAALKEAALKVGVEKFGSDFQKYVAAGVYHWPFKKDVLGKYPQFPNAVVMTFRNWQWAPGVVSRRPGPDGRPAIITEESQVIGHPDEIYGGALGVAVVSPFAFDRQVKKGVSFGLNSLQKWGDGPRLDSKRSAQDEFEADLSAAIESAGSTLDSLL
jgi:hypothetical protein